VPIVVALAVLLILYGFVEYRRHMACVRAVPIRIHVNGTRGKSSVTRLIAAGMRAGGIRTFAKTTGTEARMIFDDGSEMRIPRPGRANIVEQLMVFRTAARRNVKAIVIECMALQPHIQWLAEHRIVHSTCGVITNARADHLDVMGPTVQHVAYFLCNTVPDDGILFSAERDPANLGVLRAEAGKMRTRLVESRAEDVTDEEIRRFTYVEHKENVALALAVCAHHGVPREAAIEGMIACTPDPGVLRLHRIEQYGKQIEFANAFAANDRDSTLLIMDRLGVRPGGDRKVMVLFNTRGDRIQRAAQFGEMIAKDFRADYFLLTGQFTDAVESLAVRHGADPERIFNLGNIEEHQVNTVFEKVLSLTPARSIVVGVGNIGGIGHAIAQFFQNRGAELAH